MTHKHTLFKTQIILITTALTLAALIGCQNIFNRTPEPAVKYGKITVTVDLGETPQNARFLQGKSTQNDRSAMPSTFDGADYVFAGAVHDSSTTVTKDMLEIAESVTPDATKEKLTVVIPFKISTSDRNAWTLSIYVFKSGTTSISDSEFASPIFYGTTTITIPANAITPSAVDSVKLVPKTIPNDINGKINLKIEVPKDYALSAECKTSGHSASSCGFDFTKDTELSGASTTSDFYSFTESDTSTGIASGEHDVAFTVQKPMGTSPETYTPVYLWTETITVYPYLTTGRWTSGNVDANGIRVITESQFFSTFYVSGTSPGLLTVAGDDTNGDGSLAKPFATVQKAVDKVIAMNNGADGESYTIYIDGTVTADGTATGSGRVANISTTKNLTLSIIGLGTTKAILNANLSAATANGNVMSVSGNGLQLTLQNLKLTKGKNSSAGGGIYIGSGKVTSKDCEISGNSSGNGGGGGIFINGGTITLTNCTISGNSTTSSEGGGIYSNNGTTEFTNCTISTNSANYSGGGIYNNKGTITLTDCTISENTASRYQGGGILNKGSLTINSGNISGNTAKQHGGGIYNEGILIINSGEISGNKVTDSTYSGGGIYNTGTLTINSGIINGNSAPQNGGGIYIANGTVTITGGTISGNTAAGNGKAIYNNGTLEMSGSVQVAENNEIYLTSGKYITIAGTLSNENVSRILLPSASYANDTKVLAAKDTTVSITKGACDKFTLLNATASETSIDFTIRPNSDGTQGVIKRISMTGTAELPTDKMNFSLLVKPNGAVNSIPYNSNYAACAGDKLSFSVENENGDAIPSDATYKIAMMKDGVELIGANYTDTSANNNTVEIAIPEKFANTNMTLDIYMSVTVTVDGVTTTFDDTISVKTVKEVVVTAADFADYFGALVSAKVPDIYVTVDVSNETELKSVADKIKGISTDSNINSVDLKISGSITEISEDDTFKDCKKLVSVTIPSSITKIANWSFQNCTALKYVYIPNSVTELGNGVFNGCSSLEEITIPPSVEGLGCSIFGGCTSLKTITFTNETGFSDVFGVAFEGVPATCVAKVPNSKVTYYEGELGKSFVGFPGTIVGY